jgi:hypothetical protein
VPNGRDLADALAAPTRERGAGAAWLVATGVLLQTLARAGARHPDLNLKNVLLAPRETDTSTDVVAWLLDIDVVTHSDARATSREIAQANWARLERSLQKWRRLRGLPIGDDEMAALGALALAE